MPLAALSRCRYTEPVCHARHIGRIGLNDTMVQRRRQQPRQIDRHWRWVVLLCALGLLLLRVEPLQAQSGVPVEVPPFAPPSPARFERLGLEDGLSQNAVLAMLQDRQGFLWFGTQDGLNRYDGYTFVVYKNDPDDANSLSLLLGNGDGTFQPQKNITTRNSPTSVVISDLNGDMKPDLAVANYDSDSVTVHLSTGGGSFAAAKSYAVGKFPTAVVVTDA